jgi:hemerythrin
LAYEPEDFASIELGIPSVDAEHRGQLERMNALGTAIARGGDPAQIADDLADLIDYLGAHFDTEKKLMREQEYSRAEAHLRDHEEALALLRTVRERLAAGDLAALEQLLRTLRGWLVGHIHTADRALAGFLAERGIGDIPH